MDKFEWKPCIFGEYADVDHFTFGWVGFQRLKIWSGKDDGHSGWIHESEPLESRDVAEDLARLWLAERRRGETPAGD